MIEPKVVPVEMKLVTWPALILKTRCGEVPMELGHPHSTFKENVTPLLEFMRRILDDTQAVGLAANQCNVARRVFLMRRFKHFGRPNSTEIFEPNGEVLTVINPVITARSVELRVFIEGCLSFPEKKVQTRRPALIAAEFYDETGNHRKEQFEGLEAIIFQHEFDHINGRTMRDREYNGHVSRLR